MRGSVNQRYQLAVPEASAILGEAVEAVLVASDLEDRERVRVCAEASSWAGVKCGSDNWLGSCGRR